MKRIGFIFEKICSKENIKAAIIEASKGKHKKKSVQRVLSDIDGYASKIRELLVTKQFKNSQPIKRIHYEPLQKKTRELTILPFYPDQIVQHAIIRTIAPKLKKGMYEYCCANVPNRGEKHIRLHLSNVLKNDRKNTKYCLKLDIKQFYPSISQTILKQKLKRIIKDKEALDLIYELISVQEQGLTLGSYSSQWLANFYLQDLDHFIKEKMHIKYMYRYADDIVILGSNRRKLLEAIDLISLFLDMEMLEAKPSWRIFKVDEKNAIDFVGYKFFRNKISIRKRIFKNVRRLLLKIKRRIDEQRNVTKKQARSLMSYLGYIKNSNHYCIEHKYLAFLPIDKLKELI